MGIIYKNNIPYLEEQNLVELSNSIQTPFYVYSHKKINDTFLELNKLLNKDIYFAIKSSQTYVSRATVYRTLDILVQNNFVRKLNLGDGRARYESKINNPHHDHLICDTCHKIIEFMNPEIEMLQENIADKYQFSLKRHVHQLFGVCKACQQEH